MRQKRGFVHTEIVILVAIALSVSVVILYFSITSITETTQIARAEDAVNALTEKANAITILGKRSKDVVVIDIPEAVTARYIEEKDITFIISSREGPYNITRKTKPFLIGELTEKKGLQEVTLQKINDTLVLIGNKPYLFTIDPGCVLFSELAPGIRITLHGAGFKQGATLLQEGNLFEREFNVVNSETITFNASAIDFKLPNQQYQMSVKNLDESISNELCFETVLPNLNFCSCYPPEGGMGGVGEE